VAGADDFRLLLGTAENLFADRAREFVRSQRVQEEIPHVVHQPGDKGFFRFGIFLEERPERVRFELVKNLYAKHLLFIAEPSVLVFDL